MPEIEEVTLVVGSGDRVFSRGVSDAEETSTGGWWSMSSPIPGAVILSSIEIYHRVWVVLTRTESGQYQLFRTVDLQNYELVHTHDAEIYQIHFLDDGHAIFAAEDGIYATIDAGWHWSRVGVNHLNGVKKISTVRMSEVWWRLFTYAADKRVYRCDIELQPFSRSLGWEETFGASGICDYPYSTMAAKSQPSGSPLGWEESFGASGFDDYPVKLLSIPVDWESIFNASSYRDKWYPAIACNLLAIFVGCGSELWRSTDCGDSWHRIAVVNGAIKELIVSDQSSHAELMMVVETSNGLSTILRSVDLGDSFTTEATRIEPVVSVQSVIPTCTSDLETSYVVLGQRTESDVPQYKIIEGGV